MKSFFTKKWVSRLAALALLVICAASANAQYLLHTLANNEGATAMCRDASGNVFVLRDGGTFSESGNLVANGAVDEYSSTGTFIKTAIANTGEYRDALGDASIAVGIAVDGSDNIYVTTYNDFSASPQVAGNIVKFTAASSYGTQIALFSGVSSTNYGYFGAIACDSNGNLYAFAVKDANGGNTNVLIKIPGASTASGPISQSSAVLIDGTTFANTENNAFNDSNFYNHNGAYAPFTCLAIDASNNIFLATAWAYYEPSSTIIGYDGGNLYEYTAASGYASANLIKSSFYGSELACDPSGDVIATVITSPATNVTSYQVLNYGAAAQGGAGYPKTLYTGLKSGDLYPTGMAAVSLTNVFVTNGNDGGTNDGDAYQLTGPPTVPASNVSGGTPGPTSATITWANGGGSARAVFMEAGSSGTPTVSNGTPYSASTTFPTTPGSSWYCVYNGTGTSVTVTNLQPSTQYRAMVVEYNGTSTYTNYDLSSGTTPATGTNNPNNFTTATPTITIPGGTVTVPSTVSGTAGSSANFSISGANLVAGNLTVTAPSGFQVSGDNSSWNSSYNIAVNGTLSSTTVYVRLSASDAVNPYTGNVSISGGSATTQNQAVSGTVTSPSTTISSLTAVTSTNTNAASVQYTATFAASVSGLSASDFSLTTSGVSGASVSSVTGSGTSWTVTVNTGTGDGTIQLAMNSSSGVTPSVSNVTFTGDTYNVDKTAPTISIGSPSLSLTNTGPVSYTVTYSDANFNSSTLSSANITLNTTGTANAGSIVVTGSGTTRTVTLSGITGDGTLGISIASGTATDLAGNTAPASSASGTFTVDNTAPTISIGSPSLSATNTGPVSYTVTYSDANFNSSTLSSANITLNTTGTANAGSIVVTGSGTTRTVTLSGIVGDGTLGISIASGTATDLAGNTAPASSASTTFTVDNTPPTLTTGSYNSNNSNSIQYAKVGDVITLTAGFNEPLQSAAMTIGGNTVTVSFSNGNKNITGAYTLTTGDTEGNVPWTINVTDLAGNTRAYSNTDFGTILKFDKTPPAVIISSPSVSIANTGPVTYTVTYADANFSSSSLASGDITLNKTGTANASGIVVSGSGTSYTVTLSGITGDGSLGISIDAGTAVDIPGNAALASSASTTFSVDNTPPTVASVAVPADGTYGLGGTLLFTVNFSEPVIVNTAGGTPYINVTLNSGAVQAAYVSGSGTSALTFMYTVVANDSDPDGISIGSLAANGGTLQDAAGNDATLTLNSVGSTTNVLVDAVPPTVSSITAAGSSTTNATSVDYTVTFSEPVTGVFAGDFTVTPTGTATGTVSNVSGSGSTYTVTVGSVSGDGTLRLDLNSSGTGIYDLNSNPISGGFTSGDVYTIDNTAPTIGISSPSVSSISDGAGSVTYTVTYADANFNTSTLSTSDITLNTTGTANGTVGLSGSGTSYTVTISGITGSGRLGISIGAGTASDQAGNMAPASGASTTFQVLSNDATLGSLVISSGTLTPAFSPGTMSYSVNVLNSVSSITVTPTAHDSNALVVAVNGIPITSGTASAPIALNVGDNTVTVAVSAEDATIDTYTITVNRAASANAELSYIHLSGDHSPLSPSFDPATTSYTTTVGNPVTSIMVTPTSRNGLSAITVDGTPVASGTASSPITLNVGDNVITFVVTAQNGTTTKTYTLTVTRKASDNANLTYVHLNSGHSPLTPSFSAAITSYAANVGYDVSSLQLTPTVSDPTATVTVNGVTTASGAASSPVALIVGDNSIPIVVTAQDGTTTKTYTFTITRKPSATPSLEYIHLSTDHSPLVPSFESGITNYSTNVGNPITSLTVTPTVRYGSTVTVNGTPVASGTASGDISLNVGDNVITFVVTAEDGIATRTYTLTVTRLPSDNAALQYIHLSGEHSPFSPAFDSGTTSYATNVGNSTSSLTVTPTTRDGGATVTVNTVPVTSGTASGDISLNVGDNIITLVVTAADGTTTRTYTVTVTRAAPPADYATYQPISVVKPSDSPQLEGDGITVHQGLSPNGDGINDVLTIDGITNYPDNKLMIMSPNGVLVYEAKGYDNSARAFDGHSSKTGIMQQPGTYFYSLDYTVKGVAKHKTGFIILKY